MLLFATTGTTNEILMGFAHTEGTGTGTQGFTIWGEVVFFKFFPR
jgi:hypothetical protein